MLGPAVVAMSIGVSGAITPLTTREVFNGVSHTLLDFETRGDGVQRAAQSSSVILRDVGNWFAGTISGMRIVVWNCAMALHAKLDALYALKPDIAVISECANPEIVDRKSETGLPQSTVWVGDNQQKGLAVFAFGEWRAELDDSYDPALRILAPVLINGPLDFRVLAAWSFNRRQDLDSQRRGPLRAAAEDRSLFLNQPGPLVVAGDFNSNAVFKQYRCNSPRGWITGDLLEGLGLVSTYHYHVGCEYGKEPDPTIYWRNRTADGPVYHIDYCFVPREWTGAIMNVELGRFDDWVANGLSDHVPLIVDLDEGAIAP